MIEIGIKIFVEMWSVLGEMAIYLLFGFFVAGLLSVLISAETVERHLGGRGIWSVVKATLFGVPLPLCSCGVIPVATSLRKHGASKGAVTSFLMSTPQTGVDSILVTYSLLGVVFAAFRPIVAIVSGILGGMLVDLSDRGRGTNGLKVNDRCEDTCCVSSGRPGHGKIYRLLHHGFVVLPSDISRQLLFGLLVAGLITAVVPPHYFAHGFLSGGIGAMAAMLLVGIPSYVCASASVPLALALINLGVSPGAALVFLITGPATNAASVAMMWAILGRRATVLYLITVVLTALGAGLILDYVYTWQGVAAAMVESHDLVPPWLKTVSAIALLAVLILPVAIERQRKRREFPLDRWGAGIILKIRGMSCGECAETVRETLLACDGVAEATVDLRTGEARVRGDQVNVENLRQSLHRLGFTVE